MNQKITISLFWMPLFIFLVSFISCSTPNDDITSYSETTPKIEDSLDLIRLIQKKKSMSKVNDEPYFIPERMFLLCRMPTDAEIMTEKLGGPHKGMAINVYVNEIGKNAMTKMKNPFYPIGTKIIKEKFQFDDSNPGEYKDVELYTIMIKREEGFNPECGDWEFGVVSGDLGESQQGELESCIKCHQTKSDMDYVFRDDYLDKKYMHQIYNLP